MVIARHMEQLGSNMVELGKEANSEAERAYSSWKVTMPCNKILSISLSKHFPSVILSLLRRIDDFRHTVFSVASIALSSFYGMG
jgi:hypothetical protein